MKCAHCTENNQPIPPTKHGLLLTLCLALLCLTTLPAWAQEPATAESENTEITEGATTETTPPPKPPEPPLYSSRSERDMKLLEETLAEQGSALWLDGLDGPFLALYQDEIGAEAAGAVLILHAEGQHSDWPITIERIRNTLPYHGWITLATTLPNPALPPLPKRTLPTNVISTQPDTTEEPTEASQKETTEEAVTTEPPEATAEPQAEAGEDNEIFDDSSGTLGDGSLKPEDPDEQSQTPEQPQYSPEQIAHSRIEAAIRHLNNLGMYNIVLLGDGIGAARAGHFLNSLPKPQSEEQGGENLKPARAMVIINARNSSPQGDINLLGSLFDADLPTLDIYFGTHPQDNHDSMARKKYALRNDYKIYQQILLPELSHNTMLGENRLSKRVRGFLQKHARGVTVENAIVTRRE